MGKGGCRCDGVGKGECRCDGVGRVSVMVRVSRCHLLQSVAGADADGFTLSLGFIGFRV